MIDLSKCLIYKLSVGGNDKKNKKKESKYT